MHLIGFNVQIDRLFGFLECSTGVSEKRKFIESNSQPLVAPQLAIQVGDPHSSKNEYTRAIQVHTQALAEISKNSTNQSQMQVIKALNARALCYFHLQKYQKALADLNCIISLDPTCRSAYNMRATIFLAINNQQAAAMDLVRLREMDSSSKHAHEQSVAPDMGPNPHTLLNAGVVMFCFCFALACVCACLFWWSLFLERISDFPDFCHFSVVNLSISVYLYCMFILTHVVVL